MFNLVQVGNKIAELRKKNNLTQFELADKLGISFQAVSNWERGNSMPDISKLPELAEIFNTSVDEIVCKSNSALSDLADGRGLSIKNYSTSEIEEIGSVMKPQQIEETIDESMSFDVDAIRVLLPYLDDSYIDSLADRFINNNMPISVFLPYMSEDKIDSLAEQFFQSGKSVRQLLPYVSECVVKRMALDAFKKGGIQAVSDYLPYLDEDDVSILAEEIINKNRK